MPQQAFLHERSTPATTCEWFTPPEMFDALGIDFDLDPAAPPGSPAWVKPSPSRGHRSDRERGAPADRQNGCCSLAVLRLRKEDGDTPTLRSRKAVTSPKP